MSRCRRIEIAAAVVLPLLTTAWMIQQQYPFVDDVPLDGPTGDDWFFYKNLAVSIVRGGLTMPAIGSYAVVPHGFLYNYFVALVFTVVGVNTAYVYVVHGFLTGLAITGLALASLRVSATMSKSVLVLGGVALVADFTNRLNSKLLSENLFLFLAAAAVVAVAEGLHRRSTAITAAAGTMLGLAVLSRTSAVVWGLGVVAWVIAATIMRRDKSSLAAAFALSFAATMCLLPLREWAAIGTPNFNAITHTTDWIQPPEGILEQSTYYGRRLLFMLGITQFIEPSYRPRPHWLLIWSGIASYIFTRLKWRLVPTVAEGAILLLIPLYLVPVLLVGGVANYGGRMIAVAMPLLAVLAARWLHDQLLNRPTTAESTP